MKNPPPTQQEHQKSNKPPLQQHTHTKKIQEKSTMATTHPPPPPWTETHKKIKEKFISKLTRNQTHYHCEAPEIKPKTHPEFTPHCEAHDAGLTKPHAHAVPTSTSNLAPVACLKEEDRDVREGVRMRTKIESEEKKKKKEEEEEN